MFQLLCLPLVRKQMLIRKIYVVQVIKKRMLGYLGNKKLNCPEKLLPK